MTLHLTFGDIVHMGSDAIVNAANPQLLPGGGVSGAIHTAGGYRLSAACADWVREHGPVETGESAITKGFDLHALYVIHTVGPEWGGGSGDEARLLARAYRSAMELADEYGLASIAYPSISTGIYGFPAYIAAPIAVRAVNDALASASSVREATIVLHSPENLELFRSAFAEL
jgi:O-acetyl-ADP-ribose deacetylase (regulator of RNase III)